MEPDRPASGFTTSTEAAKQEVNPKPPRNRRARHAAVPAVITEGVPLEPERPKRKGGAHGKYTPEVVETICKALELGEYFRYACIAAGICEQTFCEWRATKPEFAEAVEKAMTAFRRRNLERIERAANKGWLAAAWLLERRFPEDFGRRTIELSGPQGGPIPIAAAVKVAEAVRNDPGALTEVQRVIVTIMAERERTIAS